MESYLQALLARCSMHSHLDLEAAGFGFGSVSFRCILRQEGIHMILGMIV